MKRLILFLTVLLLAAPALADDKADVLKAQDQFINARIKADFPALEKILTPDFLAVTHDGRFLDKTQFLAYAKERKLSKLALQAPKVRVTGGQLAVVTAVAPVAGDDSKAGGKFEKAKSAITYVWIKTAQGWRLQSVHWHFF